MAISVGEKNGNGNKLLSWEWEGNSKVIPAYL